MHVSDTGSVLRFSDTSDRIAVGSEGLSASRPREVSSVLSDTSDQVVMEF
jgi:hypothetical protein